MPISVYMVYILILQKLRHVQCNIAFEKVVQWPLDPLDFNGRNTHCHFDICKYNAYNIAWQTTAIDLFIRAFLDIILASPFCENMSRWSRYLCFQPFSIFESIYRFIDFFHFFLFIKQNHKQNMRPGNFQFCLHINLNRFSNETNIICAHTFEMLFSSAFSSFDFYFESYSISD